MDTIIEIDGADLEALIHVLTDTGYGTVYKLRVHTDGDVAQFKVNEGIWSPPLGHLDPMCTAAQLRRPFPM